MTEGDCFEVHANYMIDELYVDKEALICHGIVIGAKGSPVEGKEFVHCWIECGDVFFDLSNGNQIVTRKESVYATGRIKEETVVRYNHKKLREKLLKHEHYGPWAIPLVEADEGSK